MRNLKRTVLFLLVSVFVFATFSVNANAASKWSIIRGYGSCVGTGEGLEESIDNITYFNGYGGTCYVANTFHEAVAVEFQLIALPTTTHYFSIGLVNQEGYWISTGKEGQGIVTEISSVNRGAELKVKGNNITSAGTKEIGTMQSKLKALDVTHMLVIYNDGTFWYVSLDGVTLAPIPMSEVSLGKNSWLVIGANGSSTMQAVVTNIYADDQVTSSMKDGTDVKQSAEDNASLSVYTDAEERLIIGEIVKDGELSYLQPGNTRKDAQQSKLNLQVYIYAGSAVLALVGAVLVFVLSYRKKKRSEHKDDYEVSEEVSYEKN